MVGCGSAAGSPGDSGWSMTGTGVGMGEVLLEWLGVVPPEASPRTNLALSLSSKVVRVRAEESWPALTDFTPGLAGLCGASVLRKLERADSASCDGGGRGRTVLLSVEPRVAVVTSSPGVSWDGLGGC